MIRVAILGAGIGREHLAAFRALPDLFKVVAIVDRDQTRIKEIRGDAGFRAEADITAVLNAADVDLIDICLPPHLHAATTIAALQAGKHVICEKPLATSLRDAEAIKQAAQAANRLVFPVFQYRWGPALAVLRALIDAGLACAPQVAALETHWSRGADYYAVPWRGTWDGEQGGAVLGHAIHNHDLMTHFMGPVAAVSAMVATRVNPIETEDCAALSFQMANGALCTSSITLGAGTDETRIRFVFEHLTATSGTTPYAPGAGEWTFVARDPSQQHAIDKAIAKAPPEPVGFEGFFTSIADAINTGSSNAVSLENGIASVALVTAIYAAARSGERVALPLPDTHPLYKGWTP